MVNKVKSPPVSEITKKKLSDSKEEPTDKEDARSISSYSSSSSSLGFGDFENGTIYDKIAELDAPEGSVSAFERSDHFNKRHNNDVNPQNLDKSRNSDQITIDNMASGTIEHKNNEADQNTKDEKINIDADSSQNTQIRRKIRLIVLVLVLSVILGIVIALSTYFINFG